MELIGNNRIEMGYKIYSNITCPSKSSHRKYWVYKYSIKSLVKYYIIYTQYSKILGIYNVSPHS